MKHTQALSELGQEIGQKHSIDLDYSVENNPVQWTKQSPASKYAFISEISRYVKSASSCYFFIHLT